RAANRAARGCRESLKWSDDGFEAWFARTAAFVVKLKTGQAMYERYWKLERPAFHGSRDLESYFRSRTHQAALLKLQYLVEHRLGAGVLAGAHGLGKTLLTQMLERELGESAGPLARLVFPQMSPAELLAYLAAKLGAEPAHPQESLRT